MGSVTFLTEDSVRLEGELRMPETPPRGTAVICHPHPKHGGSKDHPILWALRGELSGTHGLATLAFNFRGVMGSGGVFGGGWDEVRDVRAAVSYARETAPDLPTVSCGWSFGANVALREAVDDDRVASLVLYGLPLRPGDVVVPELPHDGALRALRRPVLLITGEGDPFCPPEELRAFGAKLGAELVVLEGTDHYLWRREREAAALAGAFVERVL